VEVEAGDNPARVLHEFSDQFAGEISNLEMVPLFSFLKTDNYPLTRAL
jgi:hypothetical protein